MQLHAPHAKSKNWIFRALLLETILNYPFMQTEPPVGGKKAIIFQKRKKRANAE